MKLVTLVALSLNAYVVSAASCAWTPTCYGVSWDGDYACKETFPSGGTPTGQSRKCSEVLLGGYQYECCGITKIQTEECKWSYCAGAFVKGQTTCDTYGSDWVYSGRYEHSDCGTWSTNLKVECCKTINV
jgi:hypothetical protein